MFTNYYLILICGVLLGLLLMATAAATLLPGHAADQAFRAVATATAHG